VGEGARGGQFHGAARTWSLRFAGVRSLGLAEQRSFVSACSAIGGSNESAI
jgi:hypothetical protein